MVEAHGAADHVDALAAASVAQDLVALAELLALELEDAWRRRVGLASQPVALAVGHECQLARGEAPRLGLWSLEPAASAGDDVKPQVALERGQLEPERGGELGAAVEGAAQLEEVQRLAERIGGRGPRFGMRGHSINMTTNSSKLQSMGTNEHISRTLCHGKSGSPSLAWMDCK